MFDHPEAAIRKHWRHTALRDDPRCDYCNATLTRENSTVDHIVPLRAGGGDDPTNYALACGPCNNRKDAAKPEQVGLTLIRHRNKPGSVPGVSRPPDGEQT